RKFDDLSITWNSIDLTPRADVANFDPSKLAWRDDVSDALIAWVRTRPGVRRTSRMGRQRPRGSIGRLGVRVCRQLVDRLQHSRRVRPSPTDSRPPKPTDGNRRKHRWRDRRMAYGRSIAVRPI